jgi:transposase-like protein
MTAARRFFERAIATTKVAPVEVTPTEQRRTAVLDELLPVVWHRTDQYANNRVECDYGRLKSRLRPMRGRKQDRNARRIVVGHAFVQTFAGDDELAAEESTNQPAVPSSMPRPAGTSARVSTVWR